MDKKTKVLFLDAGNSACSQMAEGFLRHFADDRFEVFSAGIEPVELSQLAIRMMDEVGIDISRHYSKDVKEYLTFNLKLVITMCDVAKQRCPTFRFTNNIRHWNLIDPISEVGSVEKQIEVFRGVRDGIEEKVRWFAAETRLPGADHAAA
jgi:arsenate reductase